MVFCILFLILVITGMKGTKKKQLAEQLADYVEAVSHQPYQSPSQLKNHTRFILEHTVGCLLIYDEEFPGKTKYFLKMHRITKQIIPTKFG